MRKASTLLLLIFVCTTAFAQDRQPAFDMNARLGRGVNMGNSFEAPSETEWGNPWKPEYFKIIAELGFDHVRLPVRWETTLRSMSTSPYTITPSFLKRIQEVVDTAIRYNLHIIVNMHHHDALFENPAGQKARFLSQWRQIAEHFKDYPDNLLFEVLNEPHGNLTPELWNQYFAEALAVIRETNPTRIVLMGVAEFGGLGGVSKLEFPDDDYIILSPHYYNPFNFTHQGADWAEGSDAWLGTKWEDTEADRETVENEFKFAQEFAADNNIPIHVGEFGAFSRADMESRAKWTTFLARWFEENDMSWAYWEFSAGFGIYDPANKTFVTPLVEALLHNEMPEPIPVTGVPLYTSNFSSGTDGWSLSTQGGASGSLTSTDAKLNISLTNGGSEGWHVQLVKNNIAFEKDKNYRITFKARAASNRSATFYASKATDPWNAYSGYNGVNFTTAETTFKYSFIMAENTDPNARLVFDLGTNTTSVSIWDISVEELKFGTVTSSEEVVSKSSFTIYPNPIRSVLHFEHAGRYTTAEVYDMRGKSVMRFQLSANTTELNLQDLPEGIYLIRFNNARESHAIRVMKE